MLNGIQMLWNALIIVSMVTYTSDLNPYLCSSMNSGANHLTGTRFCNSCSVSKYISHKYAFQWDAYCPLVSRMPAWGVGGGVGEVSARGGVS